jgi:multidrug efflux pump subunit AcrA (membrane-fusion protein)
MRTCSNHLFLLLGMSIAGFVLDPPVLANSLEAPTTPTEVDAELPAKGTESTAKSETPDEAPTESPDDEANDSDTEDATENDSQTEDEAGEGVDNKEEEKEKEKENKSDSTATKDPKKHTKNRKSHKVKAEHFKVEVSLKGIMVARNTAEIILRPEVWSEFKIEEIVPHGSEVHEGQVLVRFDSRKLQEAIAALELELHLSDLAIRRAEEELPRLEKMLDLKLLDTQRNAERARDDYDRFKKLEQQFFEKMVDYTVKGSEFQLDYVLEELQQLEKMYEADDLTEETEEIILKRQRNSVDLAKFNVEDAEFYRDRALKIMLPRMESHLQDNIETTKLAFERAGMSKNLDLNRARYELEKTRQQRKKSVDRHAKLVSDKSLLELKAPTAGIVYFGHATRGKWTNMASMINKLRPYNSATSNSILMTIVKPRPLYVAGDIGEADRPGVKVGQPAKIVLPPKGSPKLEATVETLSIAPISSAKFWINLKLLTENEPEWLVAGMTCKVKVVTYDQANAIVVPKDAIHSDEDNEETKYVWVVDPDNASTGAQRRSVKTGQHSSENIEIVAGLEVGDVVSLEDEQDDADDK